MKRLRILTLFSVVAAVLIFFLKKRAPVSIAEGAGLVIKKEWLYDNKESKTPKKDRRQADQTFLTFPEWYLVFSPAEQAAYFKTHTATGFPFMAHTKQIWESYHIVNEQLAGNFPKNKGYRFMIGVIGSSATAEYSIKAWYETVIGRITDTHEVITDEDKFNERFTQNYVDFIKDRPWYEFDFYSRLKSLWSSTSLTDDHFFRKIERKYILSSELIVKSIYGKLIGLGTKTVYDEAVPTTAVVLNKIPADTSSIKPAERFADGSSLVYLPRYDKFNAAINNLAKQGYCFKEIAGNNSAILVSILIQSKETNTYPDAQVVFSQPIASNPAWKRVVIAVPVPMLNKLILQLDEDQTFIEHVFDF